MEGLVTERMSYSEHQLISAAAQVLNPKSDNPRSSVHPEIRVS